MKKVETIIIGAGICGLSLAQYFHGKRQFLILEKSKTVGGRMATRRDLPARYDHGAQFIKAGGAFQSFWQAELSSKPGFHLWFQDEVNRFAFKTGINILAKELAANFPIEFDKKVLTVQKKESRFHLYCEDQTEYLCDEIIMTTPLPQSLDILKKSGLAYDKELDQIHYAKALVALLQPKAQFEEHFANFKNIENATTGIFSISNQQSKQVSDVIALTAVANPSLAKTISINPMIRF